MAAKLKAIILAILVTLLFIGWIAWGSDWQELWAILSEAKFSLILAAACLSLPVQWLRSRRFGLILHVPHGRDWAMFRVAGLLVVFNTLIPFRLGELSFPILVNREFGTGKAYAMGVLTFIRLLDLALVVLLLSLFGFLSLPGKVFQTLTLMMAAGSVAAIIAMLFLIKPIRSLLLKYTGDGAVSGIINRVAEGAAALGHSHRIAFLGYSLTIWLVLGAMSTLAAMAVLPSLEILHGYLGAAAANIGFALPVSGVASLGPAQVAWAEALRLTGYEYPLAIASALAVHAAVLGGVVLTAFVVNIKRT